MSKLARISIALTIAALFTINGCSCSNDDGAFHEDSSIKPKIDFMFPAYSPTNESDAGYVDPEAVADEDRLAPNGAIIITLNKPVDRSTVINGQTIKVQKLGVLGDSIVPAGNDYLEGTISHKTSDNTILFIPVITGFTGDACIRMDPLSVFKITLDGIRDRDGLALDYCESLFVTKEDIDDAPPYILGIEKIVTRDNSATVYFQEPLDPRYVSTENISLHADYDPAGPSPLPVTVTHKANSAVVVIETIGFTLQAGVTYTIVLGGGAADGVRDLAGNVVEHQELSFTREQTDYVPLEGTFSINNNDAKTFSRNVTLNIAVTGAKEMRFSNDNGNWSEWEALSDCKAWVLNEGYGTKTVYGEFKSEFGEKISKQDTIVFTSPSSTIYGSNITLTDVTYDRTEVVFTWTDPADSSFDHVEITCTDGTTTLTATVAGGTHTFTQTGLTASTQYTFILKAVDTGGNSSDGRTVVVTTTADPGPVGFLKITDAHDLNAVRGGVPGYDGWGPGKKYLVTADIDLAAYTGGEGWVPIGTEAAPFTGVITGNGHVINGLTVNRSADYQGLFGYIGVGGTVSGLIIAEGSVTATDYCGLLAGHSKGLIEGCSVSGIITGSDYTGGLVGYNEGLVEGCSVSGSITGSGFTGGLVGYNEGRIEGCFASGSVTGTGKGSTGGLIGGNWKGTGTLVNCHTAGIVNGKDLIGGLAGQCCNCTVTGCSSTATVNGGDYVGGLIGSSDRSTIKECYASGTVSGNDWVGGLIGRHASNEDVSPIEGAESAEYITGCYATGTVNGHQYVGGLIGENRYGPVSKSYASGMVSGFGSVGGLIGENKYGIVSESYASGTVNGFKYIGGLVGANYGHNYIRGKIFKCYATGAVNGTNIGTGGLVGVILTDSTGYFGVMIAMCYADGDVSGEEYVGGLVGGVCYEVKITNCFARGLVTGDKRIGGLIGISSNSCTLENCYAIGLVTGNSDIGGLIGGSCTPVVTNCYYDTNTTGQNDTVNGGPKTTYQMKLVSTYLNWDFTGETANGTEDIWTIDSDINDGYPFLVGVGTP